MVAFDNQRGTVEHWITEGKTALEWTRLSCQSGTANAGRNRRAGAVSQDAVVDEDRTEGPRKACPAVV